MTAWVVPITFLVLVPASDRDDAIVRAQHETCLPSSAPLLDTIIGEPVEQQAAEPHLRVVCGRELA